MPELLEDSIRATAPRPDDEFVAELGRRVEEGFPPRRPSPAPSARRRVAALFRRRPGRREGGRGSWLFRPLPALAACTVLAVVVVTGVVTSGDDSGPGSATVVNDSLRADESPAVAGEAAPEVADRDGAIAPVPPVAPPRDPGTTVAPGEPRLVEQSTTLELRTGVEEFSDVTAGVLRIADESGAIVQSSNVTERDGRGFATYDLRVPGSRLAEALSALSRLADVRSRTQGTQDITGAYVTARDNLEDARDTRRALLRALERSDDEADRDAIRDRLREVRARIERYEHAIRTTRARANRARLLVTVESSPEAGGAWTPRDALDDAGRILEVAAGVLLVGGAIAAPLLLLGGVAAATARVVRRRRRDAALG